MKRATKKQCLRCGVEICGTYSKQYCDACRHTVRVERYAAAREKKLGPSAPTPKKPRARSARPPSPLDGKTLEQVARMARAAGMTYGAYVAKVEAASSVTAKP